MRFYFDQSQYSARIDQRALNERLVFISEIQAQYFDATRHEYWLGGHQFVHPNFHSMYSILRGYTDDRKSVFVEFLGYPDAGIVQVPNSFLDKNVHSSFRIQSERYPPILVSGLELEYPYHYHKVLLNLYRIFTGDQSIGYVDVTLESCPGEIDLLSLDNRAFIEFCMNHA